MHTAGQKKTESIQTVRSTDGHQFNLFTALAANPSGHSVVILGEIFGLTDYIKDVARRYADHGIDAYAPALYNRIGKESFPYSQEEEAHAASTKILKVDEALMDIHSSIDQAGDKGPVAVVGFSYGATLGWLAASANEKVSYFAGYYGNRIALNLEHKPACPYDLIFGLNDHGLTPDRLALIKDNLPPENLHILRAVHGFDCHHRPNTFDGNLSRETFEMILSKLCNSGRR